MNCEPREDLSQECEDLSLVDLAGWSEALQQREVGRGRAVFWGGIKTDTSLL